MRDGQCSSYLAGYLDGKRMYRKVAWNQGDALYEAVFYRMKRGVGNVREQVWDVAIREEEYGHGSVWRDGCSCSEGD